MRSGHLALSAIPEQIAEWLATATLLIGLGGWLTWYGLDLLREGLFAPWFDLAALLAVVLFAWVRGAALLSTLFIALLSLRLHTDAAGAVEGYPDFCRLAWLIWLPLWGWASSGGGGAGFRFLLVAYHAGITFDAAFHQGMGVGMSVGWEATHLHLLLLVPIVEGIGRPGPRAPASLATPALLALALLLLAHWHRLGPAAFPTKQVVLTLALVALFQMLCLPRGLLEPGLPEALAVGALPLGLAALGLSLSDSRSWAQFFGKRLFAGPIHPNTLAAALFMPLLLTARPRRFPIIPAAGRRIIAGLVPAVLACCFALSGSRWIQLVFLLLVTRQVWRRWPGPVGRAALAGGGVVTVWLIGRSFLLSDLWYNERVLIWQAAWAQIVRQPWTGWGVLAFGRLPQLITPEAALLAYDWVYPHTHQIVLEAWFTGGTGLVLLLLLLVWGGDRGWRASPGFRAIAWGYLAIGLFDLPYVTPGQAFFWVLLLASARASRRRLAVGPFWRGAALLLLIPGLVGALHGGLPFQAFREGLARLRAGRPDWREALSRAVALDPHRLDAHLQLLLMDWATGRPPDAGDRQTIERLLARWPDYYLLWFLKGRLAPDPAAALAALERSLALEPRDLTGLRSAWTALLRHRLGGDPGASLFGALSLGPWGPGLLLDHPDVGTAMRQLAVTRMPASATDQKEWFRLILAARPLLERGLAIPIPRLTTDDRLAATGAAGDADASPPLPGAPEGRPAGTAAGGGPASRSPGLALLRGPFSPTVVADEERALRWLALLEEGRPAQVLGEYSAVSSSLGVPSLKVVVAAARRAGQPTLAWQALEQAEALWYYRGKNDEDLGLLSHRAALAAEAQRFEEAAAAYDRLLLMDPGNPALLRDRGLVDVARGRPDEARSWFLAARRAIPQARLEPFPPGRPRPRRGPQGDQWTFLFELALRRHEPLAQAWYAEAWAALDRDLAARPAASP